MPVTQDNVWCRCPTVFAVSDSNLYFQVTIIEDMDEREDRTPEQYAWVIDIKAPHSH